MRAVASAYELCKKVDSTLQVVWFQDWALHAPFRSIFEETPLVAIREATMLDHILYDRARKKNLFVPALPQRILFQRHIKEQDVTPLKKVSFDFEQWARGKRCYMSCYQVFGSFPDEHYQQLFRPVKAVMDVVDGYRSQFNSHTIGLHIRRTDNAESIAKSPTTLFINKVREEIDQHADTKVFLATDSADVKKEFIAAFDSRIITPKEDACRDSISGIRGGVVDLWTLASTQKIYGSAGSSFSPMAASIGGVPLEIMNAQTATF
jgi:hypothetical protein